MFDRFDQEWHCWRYRARHRRVGESHLRPRRLSAMQVVMPGLFVPGIRVALLGRRRFQSERRVELHDGIDVLDDRTVRPSADDERTVFARRRRLHRGRNGNDECDSGNESEQAHQCVIAYTSTLTATRYPSMENL